MFRRATTPFGPLLNKLPLPSNFRFLRSLALLHGTIDRFIRRAPRVGDRPGRPAVDADARRDAEEK